METLLAALDGRGVVYVYPHLIPFNGAGRLPVHSREQMRAFLAVGAARRAGDEGAALGGRAARGLEAAARGDASTSPTSASGSGSWPNAAA